MRTPITDLVLFQRFILLVESYERATARSVFAGALCDAARAVLPALGFDDNAMVAIFGKLGRVQRALETAGNDDDDVARSLRSARSAAELQCAEAVWKLVRKARFQAEQEIDKSIVDADASVPTTIEQRLGLSLEPEGTPPKVAPLPLRSVGKEA